MLFYVVQILYCTVLFAQKMGAVLSTIKYLISYILYLVGIVLSYWNDFSDYISTKQIIKTMYSSKRFPQNGGAPRKSIKTVSKQRYKIDFIMANIIKYIAYIHFIICPLSVLLYSSMVFQINTKTNKHFANYVSIKGTFRRYSKNVYIKNDNTTIEYPIVMS